VLPECLGELADIKNNCVEKLVDKMANEFGFTGTHRGQTKAQLASLKRLLQSYRALSTGIPNFRHGLCVGADDQAAALAGGLGFFVIAFPGFPPKDPTDLSNRGIFAKNDLVMEAEPFVVRDYKIVDASDVMIATPAQKMEILRSGTWTTVRYAKKQGKPVIIIYPDGVLEVV
jgi:hypothetical protein